MIWLVILGGTAFVYFSIWALCSAAASGERGLEYAAQELGRVILDREGKTLWTYSCMDCGEQSKPPEVHPRGIHDAAEETSHGICDSCALERGLFESNKAIEISIDASAPGRDR